MISSADQDQISLWHRFARTFRFSGPPMRPAAEDLAVFRAIANEWIRRRGAPRVLLLGVTPEFFDLPWPEGTDFLAVDNSPAMIDSVWPGPKNLVRCADWLSLDLPGGSRDIILCDGGLHLLRYPDGQHRLIRNMRRIASEEGVCIFRLFAPPSLKETPEAVFEDLLKGRMRNPLALRLRLAMSLQENPADGIELGKVYNAFVERFPDIELLAAKIGWPAERILTFSNYNGLSCKYHMSTLEQTIRLFCRDPGGFGLHHIYTPSYELGGSCPTIALRRL